MCRSLSLAPRLCDDSGFWGRRLGGARHVLEGEGERMSPARPPRPRSDFVVYGFASSEVIVVHVGGRRGLVDMLGFVIATIIGNLKISISNVQIRYEDVVSNLGRPFSSGITLAKLATVTMDEQGNETFDTSGELDKLWKIFETGITESANDHERAIISEVMFLSLYTFP
ncbi:hypothetical protein Scep_014493 [Stephania cephalantha]|uniref:Uncharacterized protein n=1 Tax=Stephania cephalantha TaxID=152367 RepID=A0AAP0NZF8_9MAGN